MLRLINTKLLLAILAALAVIATVAVYQLNETAKSAAILRQQQREAERRRQEDESFRKSVDAEKKRHDVSAGNEGKTWTHYIP